MTRLKTDYQLMELHRVETSVETSKRPSQVETGIETSSVPSQDSLSKYSVSLETEIPEALYHGMKEFISSNPKWDQYEVMSSALANFLYQNGCSDRAVTEKYLNDLFAAPMFESH